MTPDNRADVELRGMRESPGGFVFGIVGWNWGPQQPFGITFFLNNTALVVDQWGRPMKGTTSNGNEVWFAPTPPRNDDPHPGTIMHNGKRVKLATHAEVIKALEDERIDWKKLTCAGWPQIPYEELKAIPNLPFWPFAAVHDPAPTAGQFCSCVVCSIRDPKMRKDALRIKKEWEYVRAREVAEVTKEME